MKETYRKIKTIILDEMSKTINPNDKLSAFTAIYLPLTEKLISGELVKNKTEYMFYAYLILFYVEEVQGFKEEVDLLFKEDIDFFKVDQDKRFSEGVSFIINKNEIAKGVELIYPKLRSFAEGKA